MENNQHAISREKRDKLFRCSKSSPGEPVKINLRMPLILSNTRSHECPLKARGKRGLVTRDSAVRRRYLSEWGSVMAATGFESSAPGRRSGTARFGCQGDPRSAILRSWPTTTVSYSGHESFPFFNHHFRPRFTSPHPHSPANTRIARRRGPFRVPLVSNTDREETVHACSSILQRKIPNLFFSRYPSLEYFIYNFAYRSICSNLFRFLSIVAKKRRTKLEIRNENDFLIR